MASIRKRGKTWQVQVRRKGFPTVSGSFNIKSDAVRWAREEEHKLDQADPAESVLADMSVADMLLRYRDTISINKRGRAREFGIIELLLRSPLGELSLSVLRGPALAAYRDRRLQTVKPATVRREMALLRHCLEVARREWNAGRRRNPFHDIKLPVVHNSRERRLGEAEHSALWAALGDSGAWYLKPLVELAVETAMRRGELLGLRWDDVDFRRRLAVLPMTKNGRLRRVPLSRRATEVLDCLPRQDDLVFPIKSAAFRQAWDRAVKRSGIKDLTFHDLRHEAISRLFEKGLSVPEVAVISGHRDYRMLFRYTHIRAEDVALKLDHHD